jgi:hypothetical protein
MLGAQGVPKAQPKNILLLPHAQSNTLICTSLLPTLLNYKKAQVIAITMYGALAGSVALLCTLVSPYI